MNLQPANIAASKVEQISAGWPAILSRWEQLEPNFVQAIGRSQDVDRRSLETEARQAALEQAIARNFSITLTEGV